MPVLVTITYPAGKDSAHVDALLRDVAEVVARDLQEPPDNVRVTVKELPGDRYAVGGVLVRDQ